jgi:hypothetical protein
MDTKKCLEILKLECVTSLEALKQAYEELKQNCQPDRFRGYPRLEKKAAGAQNISSPLQPDKPDVNQPAKPAGAIKYYEIYLDGGTVIVTKSYWEKDDMVMYQQFGGSMGVEKSRVKKILQR